MIARAKAFLDEAAPLASGSHASVRAYHVEGGALVPALAEASQFAGHRGDPANPSAILLRHHGLHIELVIDRDHSIGAGDPAGLADMLLESALTTIVDFEDSIAAVDAADKVAAYANWLGLMKGDLEIDFEKGGRSLRRALAPDRIYTAPDGGTLTLPGRSLLFVRNVGHLMTTPAVLVADGSEAPEGILDAIVTSLIALARSEKARTACQQPRGLDLYRQTQDAWARRSGVHQRSVRCGRGPARAGTPRDQNRGDGRGTADLGQSRGVHRKR